VPDHYKDQGREHYSRGATLFHHRQQVCGLMPDISVEPGQVATPAISGADSVCSPTGSHWTPALWTKLLTYLSLSSIANM